MLVILWMTLMKKFLTWHTEWVICHTDFIVGTSNRKSDKRSPHDVYCVLYCVHFLYSGSSLWITSRSEPSYTWRTMIMCLLLPTPLLARLSLLSMLLPSLRNTWPGLGVMYVWAVTVCGVHILVCFSPANCNSLNCPYFPFIESRSCSTSCPCIVVMGCEQIVWVCFKLS